jgi:hypothetical protein
VTFAGRFLCTFFTGAAGNSASASAAVSGTVAVAAGVVVAAGLDTATSADFDDCLEHALTTSKSPRSAKLANMASFCWRDQDESIVPEIVLLV